MAKTYGAAADLGFGDISQSDQMTDAEKKAALSKKKQPLKPFRYGELTGQSPAAASLLGPAAMRAASSGMGF